VPFLIDTDIFIHARDGNDAVLDKFADHARNIAISALSLAELQRGFLLPSTDIALRRARHDALIRNLVVVPFDLAAVESYALILATRGRVKALDVDHMIAAHALSQRRVLVTANEVDFKGIPGLQLENWTTA